MLSPDGLRRGHTHRRVARTTRKDVAASISKAPKVRVGIAPAPDAAYLAPANSPLDGLGPQGGAYQRFLTVLVAWRRKRAATIAPGAHSAPVTPVLALTIHSRQGYAGSMVLVRPKLSSRSR